MPDLTLEWLAVMMQWKHPRNRPRRRWGSSRRFVKVKTLKRDQQFVMRHGQREFFRHDADWIETFRTETFTPESSNADLRWETKKKERTLLEKQRSMSSSHLFPMFLGTNNQPWLKFFVFCSICFTIVLFSKTFLLFRPIVWNIRLWLYLWHVQFG